MSGNDLEQRIAQLQAALAAQDGLRPVLGDAAVEAASAALRQQLEMLESAHSRPAASAERKPVTVLFADLAGFTQLAEQVDPETVRRLMNTCFDSLKVVIDHYGGHIDKYIGDEIMVLFGAPVAAEDHAERALRAALDLRRALQAYTADLGNDPLLSHIPVETRLLDLHIGINTGLVVAGGIGAQAHQQYSVIGDAVNVASRLTDLSSRGQILVGEATYQLTAPLFDFTPQAPVQLKGKQELQIFYQLDGPKARPGQLRGLEAFGLYAPLVGREAEFERLAAAIQQTRQGQGGVNTIIGEAGVGKSRLVAELRKCAELAWYEGRCLSYGEMLSYHPFLSLLRNLMGMAPEADAAALEARLRAWLDDLLPGRTAETYPYLADLLGLPLEPDLMQRLNNLAGESRQWQTFQAFELALAALARRAPLVLVLEDLHWADPTSLALLERLLPLTAHLPLHCLLVTRPFGSRATQVFMENLAGRTDLNYAAIQLCPLSAEQSRMLIAHLLVIETLPEPARDLILSRAEGNPLFLEEILRTLISQGVILKQGERWQMAPGVDLSQAAIPTTLQGVVLARLDRLEADTKTVLQMAAVVGRIFWYQVLDYVVAVERNLETMLPQHLEHLEKVELIRQTRQHPDLEYIFKHVLIQDATYQSLLLEQRRSLHRRVAEAIETIFADSLPEQAGLLARHYEAAGEIVKAVHYLQQAGDQARYAYALPEARAFYRRALNLLPVADDETRRRLLLNLGLVELTLGDFGAAGEAYATAFRGQQAQAQAAPKQWARRPLRISINRPVRTLWPGIPSEVGSQMVIQQLFAGLVQFDSEMNIIPDLAERWEVNPAGDVYTFTLRRDACWSDGAAVTAHDFVTGWRAWLNPEHNSEMAALLLVLRGAAAYLGREVSDPEQIGVRALDDYTLEVVLESPVAYFLPLLATQCFNPAPSHCWPPPDPRAEPDRFLCNGPYKLESWSADGRLVVVRNPGYPGLRLGNVARIEFSYTTDAAERLRLFMADELDTCWVYSDYERLFAPVPADRWLIKPYQTSMYLVLIPVFAPLNDRRVRQALTQATRRPALAASPPLRTSEAARGGLIPVGMPGHSPELSAPYDLEHARQLLQAAGYAHGADLPPLRMVASSLSLQRVGQGIAQQWQQTLGVQCQVDLVTLGDIVEQIESGAFHLYLLSWIADFSDPHNFMVQAIPSSQLFPEPTYWQAAAEAARTLDVRERMARYHELDRRLLVEEAIIIPISYNRYAVVKQPRVLDYPMLPVTYFPYKNVTLADE